MEIITLSCIGFLLLSCASKPQQTEYSDDDIIISTNQVDKNEDFIKKVLEDSKRQIQSPFNHLNHYGNPNAKTSP